MYRDSALCGFLGSSTVVLGEAGSAAVLHDLKKDPQ